MSPLSALWREISYVQVRSGKCFFAACISLTCPSCNGLKLPGSTSRWLHFCISYLLITRRHLLARILRTSCIISIDLFHLILITVCNNYLLSVAANYSLVEFLSNSVVTKIGRVLRIFFPKCPECSCLGCRCRLHF